MHRQFQLISAPSILGLKPTGVENLAATLINTKQFTKLPLTGSNIEVANLNNTYSTTRDPNTHLINGTGVRAFAKSLSATIPEQLDRSKFPIVLGGDCSIIIGIMHALRSKGNYGLIFMDAHADFYQPEKSTTGEVADMDLAIVTGRGPELLTNIDGQKPYVRDQHVIHIGQRDAEETKHYGSQDIADTDIKVFNLEQFRTNGIDSVLKEVEKHLQTLHVDGFWIHFDTDVITDDENPAVDYRLPGGLTFSECERILKDLVRSERITGISVTIFNPSLDVTGEIATKIARCLVAALQ